jgi:hypothetical protein
MTKLSDAQVQILKAASEADGGIVDVSTANKSPVAGLIKRGFAMLVPQTGGPSRLLLMAAGRQALGLKDLPASQPEDPTDGEAAPVKIRRGKAGVKQEVAAEAPAKPKGKLGTLVGLLERPQGATIEAMTGATGWQAHSVRGAMSGSLKKAMGLAITSEKVDGARVYRITAGAAA